MTNYYKEIANLTQSNEGNELSTELVDYESILNTYENFMDASFLVSSGDFTLIENDDSEPVLYSSTDTQTEKRHNSIVIKLDKKILSAIIELPYHQKRIASGINTIFRTEERDSNSCSVLTDDELKQFKEKQQLLLD